jgi:hypothetical protein
MEESRRPWLAKDQVTHPIGGLGQKRLPEYCRHSRSGLRAPYWFFLQDLVGRPVTLPVLGQRGTPCQPAAETIRKLAQTEQGMPIAFR